MNESTRVFSQARASVASSAMAVFTGGGASLLLSLPTVGASELVHAGGSVGAGGIVLQALLDGADGFEVLFDALLVGRSEPRLQARAVRETASSTLLRTSGSFAAGSVGFGGGRVPVNSRVKTAFGSNSGMLRAFGPLCDTVWSESGAPFGVAGVTPTSSERKGAPAEMAFATT